MKADLHVHTTNTDCSDSPEAVFRMAKKNQVTHLAITDHDTLYGIEENRVLSLKYGVNYIPGVEISAYDYDKGVKCHIIGLYVKKGYLPLDELLATITKQRHRHSHLQVEKLIELGYDVTWNDFAGHGGKHGLYKQHIMEVLIRKGIADSYYGAFYGEMFKKNGPLAMEIDYPSHTKAVMLLAKSGAIPILAHPSLYDNLDAVELLVQQGLQGIEAVYPSCSKSDQAEILAIADHYGLYVSGGSDYHGRYAGHSAGQVGSYYVNTLPI